MVGHAEGLDDGVDVSVNYLLQWMVLAITFQAMVGNAILGPVIRADFLAAIAAFHHALPCTCDFCVLALQFHFVEP